MADSIKVADIFARFGFKIDKKSQESVTNTINGVTKKQKGFSEEVVNTGRNVRKLRGQFSYLRDAVALAAGAFTLGSIKDAIVSGDQYKRTLEAVTDSSEEYAEVNEYVNNLTDRLGLNLKNTSKNFIQFREAAKGDLSDSTIVDIFTNLNQVSTVLGLSADDTHGSIRALTQMISKGKVSSEELRSQLGERLPGALKIAAKAMGLTQIELQKMMDNGELMSKDFLPKFGKALGEVYGSDEIANAAQGLMANTQRVVTSWERMWRTFGENGGQKMASDTLKSIADLIGGLTSAMDELAIGIATITSPIRAALVLMASFVTSMSKTGVGAVTLGFMLLTLIAIFKKWTYEALISAAPMIFLALGVSLVAIAIEDLHAALEGKKSIFEDLFGKDGVESLRNWVQLLREGLELVGEVVGMFATGNKGALMLHGMKMVDSAKMLYSNTFGDGSYVSDGVGGIMSQARSPTSIKDSAYGRGNHGMIDRSTNTYNLEMQPGSDVKQFAQQVVTARKPKVEGQP